MENQYFPNLVAFRKNGGRCVLIPGNLIAVVAIFFCCAPVLADPGEFIAGYHLDGKLLLLGKSLQSPDGGLRDFEDLSGSEIATLYHELWHAWLLECDTPREGPVYRRMREAVDALYADFPEDKRMEIQEEAIAAFVDAVVETYVAVYRHLERFSIHRRREVIDQTEYLDRTYGFVFEDRYDGYYTRSIGEAANGVDRATTGSVEGESGDPEIEIRPAEAVLGGFFRDAAAMGLPVGYPREAADAIEGVVFIDLGGRGGSPPPRADVVFSGVFLERADLEFLSRTLLEGKLPPDPKAAFSEERFGASSPAPAVP